MRIDHVVVAVGDLDPAARRFEGDFGLASVEGGRHPGWGTANRIVPLGESYVELIGVVDPDQAAANPFGRSIQALASTGGLANWCVAPDDFDAVSVRLGLTPVEGSRVRPDGAMLRWRSAGLETAVAEPCLPFFIAWEIPPEWHPGRAGLPLSEGFAWIEVSGDPPRIAAWLGEHDMPLRIIGGPPGIVAIGIRTGGGEVVLR